MCAFRLVSTYTIDKRMANDLQKSQSQVVALQQNLSEALSQKIQTDRDLKGVMQDLESAILENEKLNSEKIVDENDKSQFSAKNLELKRILDQMTSRFENHIQESSKMTQREEELIEQIGRLEGEVLGLPLYK